jgi:hypothetical protein
MFNTIQNLQKMPEKDQAPHGINIHKQNMSEKGPRFFQNGIFTIFYKIINQ